MKPVRTARANIVYVGPPGIGDLHAERVVVGHVHTVWHLTRAERAAIAAGANIALDLLTEPIPPVRLEVTSEAGVGEDEPAKLARHEQLAGDGPST